MYLVFLACVNQILDEEGFVGDIRSWSHDIQSSLDQYDTPRLAEINAKHVNQYMLYYSYAVSIVMCSLTLIVIIILILGLLCGGFGFRRNTMPSKRVHLSNCGGVTLIYL